MKRRYWICLALAAMATLTLVVPVRALVWAPLPAIRARLLCATHRGTSKSIVLHYLADRSYRILESSDNKTTKVHDYPVSTPHATYVKAEIGRYRVILRADVVAFYLFSEHDQLIDVVVERFVDAP
jgi:hypothetical protein